MKRDMDLIRKILLLFEETETDRISMKKITLSEYSKEKIFFHVEIMKEAGLLHHSVTRFTGQNGRSWGTSIEHGLRPTMLGYDFLDAVRDPEMWKKTKEGALQAGGWTFDLLLDLAKGFARKKIEDLTGIKL
jgi:hypothetical protein